jgi:hypothetical protein
MDLNGFLRELAKVDIGDPANRRWGWAASYLGQCLDIPRAERTPKIRALVFPGADSNQAVKTQLAKVECAIVVATLPSHAEAAADMASSLIADPSTPLSCILIAIWENASAPRLASAVALLDGPWTGNLAAFLNPVKLKMVKVALKDDDDLEGHEADEALDVSTEDGPLILDGNARLIAINDTHLIGDLIGVDLPIDTNRHPWLEIAAADWLALASLGTSEPPGVFCIARVAIVTQRATSTVVVFDRAHIVPTHSLDLLSVELGTDFFSHRPVTVPTSDIGKILVSAGVDPGRMTSSLSRLTCDSVRESAPELIILRQTVLACTSSLASGRNLILRGEPGTGKSTLAWALADAAQRIGLLSSPARSVGKDESDGDGYRKTGVYPPNPFDYRASDYRPPAAVSIPSPGQGPIWAIVDDLTASQAVERCERAFKEAVLTDNPVRGAGRVIITTCMPLPALAEHLGPAMMHRFAMVEIKPPQESADWSQLLDQYGPGLPVAARARLLELAESGTMTPGALIDLARQANCLLISGDVPEESSAEALSVALSTYVEGAFADV